MSGWNQRKQHCCNAMNYISTVNGTDEKSERTYRLIYGCQKSTLKRLPVFKRRILQRHNYVSHGESRKQANVWMTQTDKQMKFSISIIYFLFLFPQMTKTLVSVFNAVLF